jgi:hypothetical protein
MLINVNGELIPESSIRKICEKVISRKGEPYRTNWCVELIDGEKLTDEIEPKTLYVIPNTTSVHLLIVRCWLDDAGQFGKTIHERAIAAWHIQARNENPEKTDCTPIAPGETLADERRWCYFDASTGEHWEDCGFYGLTRSQAIEELVEGMEEYMRRERERSKATAAAAELSATEGRA